MKIALVTDAWQPQVSGVVTTLLDLVRELSALGHEVDVIHPGRFNTRACPGHPHIALATWPGQKLAEIFKTNSPDAIHLATEGPLGWAARRHCLRHNLPFTTSVHARLPGALKAAVGMPLSWGHALLRRFHAPSSGVLVSSPVVMAALANRGYQRLHHWAHSVDTRMFGFEPKSMHGQMLGPLARPIYLYVGRVSSEKNIEDFLTLELPGSKVVCGVGPLEVEVKDRFPHVHWMGVLPRSDLANVCASADVLVFPSRSEPLGRVALEAMACGTPVACHPVEGNHDVLKKGQGGVMSDDLREAALRALMVPRHHARLRALDFSAAQAGAQFAGHLIQIKEQKNQFRRAVKPKMFNKPAATAMEMSQIRHIGGK